MKRLIALLAVGAAVAAVLAVPSVAVDTKGPPCADIVFGDGGYAYYDTDGVTPLAQPSLDLYVDLAASSCAAVTYTLHIYDSTGALVDTVSMTDVRGQSRISFNYTFARTADADPAGLCVFFTTSLGKHVADRANDEGCVLYVPDESPGVGFQ